MVAAWYDVHSYRALADALPDDVAVSALAVVDHGGGAMASLYRVEPLVDASLDLVRDWTRERGAPCLAVVGWSIGGVVAYEIGQQLDAGGHPVETIALIDTYFPGEHSHLWSNRWWKYKSMLRPGSFRAAFDEFVVMMRRRVQRYAATVGRRLLAWAGQPVERPAVEMTFGGVPMTALDHDPSPGRVPVVLYAATTTNPQRTEHPWRTVAPDLRVVRVEGRHRGHASIMGEARVHQIADDLAAIVS
jgi:thioesterase domain-containing protein